MSLICPSRLEVLENKSYLLCILHRMWVGPPLMFAWLNTWVHSSLPPFDSGVQYPKLWTQYRRQRRSCWYIMALGMTRSGSYKRWNPVCWTCCPSLGDLRNRVGWVKECLLLLSCHLKTQDLPDSHRPGVWDAAGEGTWKASRLETGSPILMDVFWSS